MAQNGFLLKEKWEFQHWSNPGLRELMDGEFTDTTEREIAWKVISLLNAKYPGAWELLRGELQHLETRET